MPINGNADSADLAQYAPTMTSLDIEASTLTNAKVLQVIHEINDAVVAKPPPPATSPATAIRLHSDRQPLNQFEPR